MDGPRSLMQASKIIVAERKRQTNSVRKLSLQRGIGKFPDPL